VTVVSSFPLGEII
jgi:hypothetical protein